MVHVSICDDDERLRLASHVYLVYVTVSIIKRVAGTFFFELRDSPISITRTEIMFDYRFEGRTGKELSYQ
jgi:hypothetical protein